MTTDKKTLADVQPGGRVRLGDQVLSTSEGARRYVADFFATQLRRHDFGDYILTELAGDFACALAQHLSAQPTPGGQGDTRIPFETWAKDGGFDVSKFKGIYNSLETRAAWAAWLYWQRLAARQPAGEPVAEAIERLADDVESCVSDACGYLASDSGWDDYGIYRDDAKERYRALPGRIRALAVPPAQAVDLGAVRALLQRRIEQWRSHLPADPGAHGTREIETKGEHDYNNDVRIYREGMAVMEEVLSKIDGQAVGK